MPSQRTGARPVSARVAATPDRPTSRLGREGSTDSIGRPGTRRQSVGPQPSSAAKRPTSATPSSRRSSAVGGGACAKDRVTCIVRKRPAKDSELDVVNVVETSVVQVAEPKQKVDLTRYTENHQFTFDHAFCERSRNEEVYNVGAKPLVQFVFEGGMGTCFAFGQTGSGKTFTMLGAPESGQRGLYLLAADDMFRLCEESDGLGIFVSMMEIYGDEVFDLLSRDKKKLVPREDAKKKVQIAGLTEFAVHSSEELMMAIEEGSQLRSTSTTGMNEQSSRSHAILQMTLRTPRGKLHGQMSFIDLAGSEKGSDTAENQKKTRMEGAEINKSLLALKECIRSMTNDSSYTPFRSSKLTQVLKESFVGNGRTVMIANISPAASSSMETVNTLRYADRVKAIGKGGSAAGKEKTNLIGASSYTSSTSVVRPTTTPTTQSYFEARQAQQGAAAPRNRAVKGKNPNSTLDMSIEKENMGNRGSNVDNSRHRRTSQAGLGRYDASMVEASFDDEADDSEMPQKRRRSLTRTVTNEVKSQSSQVLSLDASECSFEDLDLEDTEDHAYVYHGETARANESRAAPSTAASKPVPMEPAGDPVEFVNLFRSQIEKSMALIEQEVVMLDRLERGGETPLTSDNVDAVQRLLQERMTIATTLQSELRRYAAV